MDPFLPPLLDAGRIDEARRQLAERRRGLVRKRDKAQADVDAAAAAVEATEAAIRDNRQQEQSLQREIDKCLAQEAAAQRALDAGIAADKAAHQRDTAAARRDDLETEVLEALEAREALETARDAQRTALAEAEEAQTKTMRVVGPALDALDAEDAEAARTQAAAREALPRELRGTYDTLVARKGRAVVVLDGRTCTACRRDLPYEPFNDVKAGRIIRCAGCGRYVVASFESPVAG